MLLCVGNARAWRSTLYPVDWQPPAGVDYSTDPFLQDYSYAGYHRGDVPLPQPAGPVFDVTAAPYNADSTGHNDSTAAIQAAIDAAQGANGGVVLLPAGTYRVQPASGKSYALRISASNVVLRGAGADVTRILNASPNMRNKSILLVESDTPLDWRAGGTSVALVSDLNGPVTKIPVGSSAAFDIGDWVSVRNDFTDAWANEHGEPDWLGQGAALGGLAYLRRVTAKDANSLTIDIPTRYALKTRDFARVVKLPAPLTEIGIEKLSFGNVQSPLTAGWGDDDYNTAGTGAYACHSSYVVSLVGVADSWVREVSSFADDGNTSTAHYLSNGLRLDLCRSVTILNCTFQRPQYGGASGNGYAYRFEDSSDNLVDGCTAAFTRHGYLFSGMATSGNVLHRCTDRQTARYTGPNGSVIAQGRGSEHHAHFSHSNLIDACTADSSLFLAVYRPFGTAPKHDLSASNTVFWNTQGTGDANWEGAPGSDVVASQQSRYGYVIGTRGTRSGVNLAVYYGAASSAAKTSPVDIAEGVGQSATLEPGSLYEDQLARRTGQSIFSVSAGDAAIVQLPQNQVALGATVKGGPPAAFVDGAATFQWSIVRNPGNAVLSSTSGANVTATLDVPGVYEFKLTATWNGQTAIDSVIYELRGTTGATRTFRISVDKDATLRNGTPYSAQAFGTDHALQMKFSSNPTYQREILLRFSPLLVSASDVQYAALSLTPVNVTGGYTAAIDILPGFDWSESKINWKSRPTSGSFAADWLGVDGVKPLIDITAAVQNALLSRARLFSLRIRATTSTPGNGVISFRSKDGSATLGPQLTMRVRAASVPVTPIVRVLTHHARYIRPRAIRILGTATSGPAISQITLTVQRGHTVKCRLDRAGRNWVAIARVRPGNNKIIVIARNRAGFIGRTVATVTAN